MRCGPLLLGVCGWLLLAVPGFAADPIKILFLGDNGHHRPGDLAVQLVPVLKERGIEIKYTDDVSVLKAETLNQFDGLLLFANIDAIEKPQADALLAYVESGKGFIPVHCASYCFRNDDRIVALMGGQFEKHGTGVFRTRIVQPNDPIMKGFDGFASFDETYVHTKHNDENRVVLEVRADDQGFEPYTWTRTQGQGRVFYTAWGHDERTWSNPGFVNLMERGIRWAVGRDPQETPEFRDPQVVAIPEMTPFPPVDDKTFQFEDVGPKIPHYTKGQKWGVQGDAKTLMQKPLSPLESIKRFSTPVGFEVQLYAAEVSPEGNDKSYPWAGFVGKPISMTWDERGRLWVCETYDYPNELQPQGQGRDRIRICEDTDGNGQADKFTVFAEKLSIPTAIVIYRGGAIVQDGIETIYYKDTDGDDKADLRQVLLTGWAVGDTHGGVSNFRYGLDNWIYAMQGYNDSTPAVGEQEQQRFRQGFFRFRVEPASPQRKPGEEASNPTRKRGESDDHGIQIAEVEFLRSTNNNTWGLGIGEDGEIYGSTANHCPSVHMAIPNRFYENVRGWSPQVLSQMSDSYLFQAPTDKIRQVDQFGGYTAGAGHAVYTGRTYPQEYWNRIAFVCEPTAHLVGAFVMRHDGTQYTSQNSFNLLASDDEWSAPIMAEVGPDGNVWVLDWYNYIVQHNPTPAGFKTGKGNAYESDLRDKRHGRIYRIVPTATTPTAASGGRQSAVWSDLSKASPVELVAALTHQSMERRLQAQRLLIEKVKPLLEMENHRVIPFVEAGDKSTVPALIELVKDQSVDAAGLNVGAIHAIWTLQGLGVVDGQSRGSDAVAQAMFHPSPTVQRNAVLASTHADLRMNSMWVPTIFSQVAPKRWEQLTPQVQLASLLKIAETPSQEQVGIYLAFLAQRPMEDRWLIDALTAAACTHGVSYLNGLAEVKEPSEPWKAFNGLTEGKNPSALSIAIAARVTEHIARGKPTDEELNALLAAVAKAPAPVAETLVAGVSKGWPRDQKNQISEDAEQALLKRLSDFTPGTRGQLVRLATTFWGSKAFAAHVGEIAKSLQAAVGDSKQSDEDRIQAAKQWIEFAPTDGATVESLIGTITPQVSNTLAVGLVEAAGGSTAETAGDLIIARLASLTPEVKRAAIRSLLARPASTMALLTGVENGKTTLEELTLDQKQALANHPESSVRDRAKKLLSMGGGLPNPDREKVVKELHHLTEKTGDPVLGKAVFTKNCAKCHMHSGEGNKIGPDLTGMAVHPKHELLIHILDPSRSVEGNFRIYTVTTVDGLVLTGMLAGETKTSIELVDTEGKRKPIQREDIDELVAGTKSVMPEGFEKTVPQEDLTNLLEFLTQKGKYLPLDLRKIATTITTRGMFFNANGEAERLVFNSFEPKTFEGVPFQLIDPQGDRVANAVMLNGHMGDKAPTMPKSVKLPVNSTVKAIHMLGGIGGWSFPAVQEKSVTMIVRLHYANGQTEDHELKNGVHFADYIRRVDVPESKFAYTMKGGQQVRYLKIEPQRNSVVTEIELIKNDRDPTAPVTLAITVETK